MKALNYEKYLKCARETRTFREHSWKTKKESRSNTIVLVGMFWFQLFWKKRSNGERPCVLRFKFFDRDHNCGNGLHFSQPLSSEETISPVIIGFP